jgi:Response regulator containing CheY-like receiver domain and AraC-type DNA-binding domain
VYALRALKANAIDYLLKPVDGLELREAVTKAITVP